MKRMILAAVVMLVVSVLAGELLNVSGFKQWQLQPALVGLFAAGVAGFIARSRFVPIALLVHALVWLVSLYMLHRIANGQSAFLGIARYNAVAMAASFSLVGVGAYLGQRLSVCRRPGAPAAA